MQSTLSCIAPFRDAGSPICFTTEEEDISIRYHDLIHLWIGATVVASSS